MVDNPVPCQQLNTFLFNDLRPLIATIGPWNGGYGLQNDNLEVSVLVISDAAGINFNQHGAPSSFSTATSSVSIKEIQDASETAPSTTSLELNATRNVVALYQAPPPSSVDAPTVDLSQPTAVTQTVFTQTESMMHVGTSTATTDEPLPGLTSTGFGLAIVGLAPASSGPLVTRGRRTKALAPVITTEVRRSSRTNKYNGFRVPSLADTSPTSSKVKPRMTPSAGLSSAPDNLSDEIPPPTPLHIIQEIGVNRCAIPREELTDEALLAEPGSDAGLSVGPPPLQAQGENPSPPSA